MILYNHIVVMHVRWCWWWWRAWIETKNWGRMENIKKVDVIAEKVTGVEKTSIQSCIRDDSWGKSQFVHSKKIKWIKSSSYDYWCELRDRENSLHRCYFIYPVDIHGYKTMKWKTAAVKHWKICKQAYNEKNERGNNENLVFKLVSMNIEVWVDVWE